jgi:transcriptional regulator with XRE-family HTH domain
MLHDREKITALRQKLGLSINELGRRAGITGPSMHAIESGETKNLRAKTLMGIASALGVRVQDILKAPPRGHKGNGDLTLEAIQAFSQLDDKNKLAMIAAMSSLAAQQKKK